MQESPPSNQQDTPRAENIVEELLTQPCLTTQYTPDYVASLERPVVDEGRIDSTVGSNSKNKRRTIINLHRDLWNEHLATVVECLRREYLRACGRIPFLRLQFLIAWIRFHLTLERSWFVRWPSGAVALWGLLLMLTVMMLGASGYGVYKLTATLPALADSQGARVVLATIAAAAVFGVELGLAAIESPRGKKWSRIILSTLTGVLLIAYIVGLSLLTGGLGADVLPIDRIGDPAASIGQPWLSPHVQWIQLLLESCASLAASSFAGLLVERHGTPDSDIRPVKRFRSRQLHAAKSALSQERTLIGCLRGARIALLSERKWFVNAAVISFERKLLLARRQEDGIRRHRDEANPSVTPPNRVGGLLHRIFN